MRLASDARALDTSSAWYRHVGAAVALPWLAGLDRAAVHAHRAGLAGALGLGLDPAGSGRIVCSARAGAARPAFHLYNIRADAGRALEALT